MSVCVWLFPRRLPLGNLMSYFITDNGHNSALATHDAVDKKKYICIDLLNAILLIVVQCQQTIRAFLAFYFRGVSSKCSYFFFFLVILNVCFDRTVTILTITIKTAQEANWVDVFGGFYRESEFAWKKEEENAKERHGGVHCRPIHLADVAAVAGRGCWCAAEQKSRHGD